MIFLGRTICATSKQHVLDTLGSLSHSCSLFINRRTWHAGSGALRQTWTPGYGVANFPFLLFAELGYSRWPLSIVTEVDDLPQISCNLSDSEQTLINIEKNLQNRKSRLRMAKLL